MNKTIRCINRLLRPYVDFKGLGAALWMTPWYISTLIRYRLLSDENVFFSDLYPVLRDYFSPAAQLDSHYFQQDLWVASRIIATRPPLHVDIGSRFDGFVAQLSLVVPVEFVDIRPLKHRLANARFRQGTLCSLPYEHHSVLSLSTLHVVEHVGLGRYGDPLDPQGPLKALRELQRVLAVGGVLYLSVPIGIPRVCFNSHRVFAPHFVIEHLPELSLTEFKGINDKGIFMETLTPEDFSREDYGLGIYEFHRVTS